MVNQQVESNQTLGTVERQGGSFGIKESMTTIQTRRGSITK